MNAEFSQAISFLIKAEGVYSNRPTDYGGQTKYGISKRQYPKLDIENLSLENACYILENDYWKKYRIGEIREQIIANQFFINVVNMNPLSAGTILQKAINGCRIVRPPIEEDGIVGTKTIDKINWFSPYETLFLSANIRNESCRYYLKRVDDDITQLVNLRSWIRRSLLC